MPLNLIVPKLMKILTYSNLSHSLGLLSRQGALHWVSKCQSTTARSSTETEIIATDKCLKWLQHISHILDDLNVKDLYFPTGLLISNDNNACAVWSKGKTTKGLRHINMRDIPSENWKPQALQMYAILGETAIYQICTQPKRIQMLFTLYNAGMTPCHIPFFSPHNVQMSVSLRGVF